MSIYPNSKPFEHVEDLISTLFLRDGCDPGTVSWACQTRQHSVIEEIIRIQLSRSYIPADLNTSSDQHTARVLGLNRGYVPIDSTYLFPMRAISSGDPLILTLCHLIRSNTLTSVQQFDQLINDSPVYQAYKSLLLAYIGLPLKSINQYCMMVWLDTLLDDPNEDLSMWLIPKQRDLASYSSAMGFQTGQIELLCDALFNNLVDAAIQQRRYDVIIKLLERFITKHTSDNNIEKLFLLKDTTPITTTNPSDTNSPPSPPTQPQTKLIDAFITLITSHLDVISDDIWTQKDEHELLFVSQLREKHVEQRRQQFRAQLSTAQGLSMSSSSLSVGLGMSMAQVNPNALQPNCLTNIIIMYKTLTDMHFFSSLYVYSTRDKHFANLQEILIPIFPQYLWPTSDRCIIKLLSMALSDEGTSNYIGEIDPRIFEIPSKKNDEEFLQDPEVKVALMIQDEEVLLQKALDVEQRRGLWKLALIYACNLNDVDLIANIVELSKVTKLDQFLPESLVSVNGTILAQICNLPHCNANTLHKLLTLYTFKITTNSQSLSIRSNSLFRIATREHIVIINQHPILQQVLGLENEKITDYSHFEAANAIRNGTHKSIDPSTTRPNNNNSNNNKQKINHQLLHQEAVLQCLYSLLAYVTRLKIYRPAIVYSDLVIILQVHTSQGVFMPQLYDFLISTVMSDVAVYTMFKRGNIINVINSIYSTPKNITHQLKVITDDYYRYAEEKNLLDVQYDLDSFLVAIGHRKRSKRSNNNGDNDDLLSSTASLDGSDGGLNQSSGNLNHSSGNLNHSSSTLGNKENGASGAKEKKNGNGGKSKQDREREEVKLLVKSSFKPITSDIFNTSLPLFNSYFNFIFNRFATVQIFLNSKTIHIDAMAGITTFPSSDMTNPLDNAVLYHDVPTVDYLLSLGFVPLSSTMYHLHQHFIFDHRNASNSNLFSVHGVQPVTLGQTTQLEMYNKLYPLSNAGSTLPTTQNTNSSSTHITQTQSPFTTPHRFFTPTASYHFDLTTYENFVAAPTDFYNFRNSIFAHLKLQRTGTSPTQSSTLKYLTPRDIFQYYTTSSPATELMKMLLKANCPVFPLKLLLEDDKRLYQQALQRLAEIEEEKKERAEAGEKDVDNKKDSLSMYDMLEEQYPGFDSTLITSRLETLFSIDFHSVQFHQLYHQQQMMPQEMAQNAGLGSSTTMAIGSKIPKAKIPQIVQEDMIALLLSAQHNGNPLLIYHIVQTTQLYMSIYTASFLASSSSSSTSPSAKPKSMLSTSVLPYPTIHDALPPYSIDTLTPDGMNGLKLGLSVEEIIKNSTFRKLAATFNAILPLLAESPRPLQLTRAWAVMCGRYMYNLQRLPSSLLLSLTFIPVMSPNHTFDLIQSYLYGYGDPTSHNPTTGRNVLSLLLSLCGCASDTPAFTLSSSSPVSSSDDDNEDEQYGLDDDIDSGNGISRKYDTKKINTTSTTTKLPQKVLFNPEAFAMKQNAYEFATGVIQVICGMNNMNKHDSKAIEQFHNDNAMMEKVNKNTQFPSAFHLFHAKPLPFAPITSPTPQSTPGLSKEQNKKTTTHPNNSKTMIPWPNPYKYHYYYSPKDFCDVLGSNLAMFILSRKTIEDVFCLRLLKFLVQNGEDITSTNLLGQNALMIAIAYQRSEDIITFLLQQHNITTHNGNNAILADDILFTSSSASSGNVGMNNDIDGFGGQGNYHQGMVPNLVQVPKKIDVNQVDLFGRNIFHYRLNPDLQYDGHLFSSLDITNPANNKGNADKINKCDKITQQAKTMRVIEKLRRNEDFIMLYPDFEKDTFPANNNNNNDNNNVVNIVSHSEYQGVRWYNLCDGLMKGVSGVYDDQEVDVRSREFGYQSETFTIDALKRLIQDTRGEDDKFTLEVV